MRIEKLNSNKIKVTLTTADLTKLDISIEQLAPNSKELHTFLFHIMETIREETDFNPYSGQVVVEATPSSDGISIIVSKLKTSSRKISKTDFMNATSVKASKKKITRKEIFYFDSFDDLCTAIIQLDKDALLQSSLYSLDNTYCVMIENSRSFAKSSHMLSEFALRISSSPLQTEYIKEHGTLIAKHNDLACMAEKLRQII